MGFSRQTLVRFAHVDAAGIVFYPRYFEMVNAIVEDLFAACGEDFAELHLRQGKGVPTANVAIDFTAPSRLGELLDFDLALVRLGRSALTLGVEVRCAGTQRLTGSVTLVRIDLASGASEAWPSDLAARLRDTLSAPAI
ncbi:MAG: thioesterase family protein [Pseudomonadota bacterium]|uniref:acyl-CoA thioesterase n=1 Tax=Sphingomonas sp. ERG5 TaxID=1381597 RepID=UPI00054B8767|nr:thioesterase family protein [Sphingomonas sp. ERG5]